MKNVFVPGMKTRGPCETCVKFVAATYGYGPFQLSDGTLVDDVMRAVCDECGSIVAVAQQSAPAIKRARDQRKERLRKQHSTIRLPRALVDFAAVKLSESGAPPGECELLLKAFAMSLAGATRTRRQRVLHSLGSLEDPVLEQPCEATINLNLGEKMWEFLETLERESGSRSASDLIRRILIVLEQDREVAAELRKLVLVS